MANSFQDLGLSEALTAGLAKQGIDLPTPIQAQVIPAALLNRDLAGEGETGSGKTLAYLLPIMARIQLEKRENQAIVLVPTHELAIQVNNQIKTLAENSGVKISSTVIIGDVNIQRQVGHLEKGQAADHRRFHRPASGTDQDEKDRRPYGQDHRRR